MNQFEKIQSAKILATYGQENVIKKAKKADIGTIRNYSGYDYIKTVDGWKPHKNIQKQPEPIPTPKPIENSKVENNLTSSEIFNLIKIGAGNPPNEKELLGYYPKINYDSLVEKGLIKRDSDNKIVTTQNGQKIIDDMRSKIPPIIEGNFKNLFHTGYPVIDQIMDGCEDEIHFIARSQKKSIEREGKFWTQREQEYLEIELVGDLLSAIGGHVKKDDKMVDFNIDKSLKGNFLLNSVIERDGKQYNLSTEAIPAGGYNIQVLHLRYITHTDLPRQFNAPYEGIQFKLKKMKEEDKLKKNIKDNEDKIKEYEEKAEKIKDTTDKYEGYNLKSYQSTIKECIKKRPILQAKLDEFLASKEIKHKAPEEGDYKVVRSKDHYDRLPIKIQKFVDGNWKQVRATNFKHIGSAGFKYSNDEDVLNYHKFKKQQDKDNATNTNA